MFIIAGAWLVFGINYCSKDQETTRQVFQNMIVDSRLSLGICGKIHCLVSPRSQHRTKFENHCSEALKTIFFTLIHLN